MSKFDEIIERFKAAKEEITKTSQESLDSGTAEGDLEKADLKGVHTSTNPAKPGRSTMGIVAGVGDMGAAKIQATKTLHEIKSMPKPKLGKDEDGFDQEVMKINSNGQWSLEKGRDVLADRVTSAPGVSPQGIEARRGDAKIPASKVMAHGYGRVTADPAKHLEVAKEIARENLKDTKEAPKPKL